MSPLATMAALALAALALMAWACWRARRRAARDWRDEWCCLECMAAHDQKEPCGDCPARRAAHK